MHLVVFDLETTGFSPYYNEIIQIAAIRIRDGAILNGEVFATYVKPLRPIPEEITAITGVSQTDVEDAPGPVEALQQFTSFAGDATLVAHNGRRFDLRFIQETRARHSMPPREWPLIDSMDLSKKLWPTATGHTLDDLIRRLNIKPPEDHPRHDARHDVHILAIALIQMLTPKMPSRSTNPQPFNPFSPDAPAFVSTASLMGKSPRAAQLNPPCNAKANI
jgi:DNA polymerase III alpha subunit (gram-positive type)